MARDGEKRRVQLFRRYSKNLQLWRPELVGQYACPLCLRVGFTEEAVLGPQPELTVEHSIPNGLGASCSVLTCAECNNRAGSRIDSQLHQRLEWDGFWNGNHQKQLNVRITIAGQEMGAQIRRTGGPTGEIEVRIVDRQSRKESVENSLKALETGNLNANLKILFGRKCVPDLERCRIAFLKCGYLLMFRDFGYGYILSSVLDPIRKTIREAKPHDVPLADVVLEIPISQAPSSICAVTDPEQLRAFAVPIRFPDYEVARFVIMPNDGATYTRWAKYRNDQGRPEALRFSWKMLPFRESLLTERNFMWSSAQPTGRRC